MEILFDRFRELLGKLIKAGPKGKMLLAVSGGIDSVVMLHLFHRAGYDCEVAHCNFQLRGTDSDQDEHFVEQLSGHYSFPFHITRFSTSAFALDNAISIQMAARRLRYKWFDELAATHNFTVVAVAHHADDVAETMLLNLVKGTGIAGMHGIKAVNKRIIRPLLFATKSDLEVYAFKHSLHWREDASNIEAYYLRNKIRHLVMPVLKEINPEVTGAMLRYASLMEGYEAIIFSHISEMAPLMVKTFYNGTVKTISMEKLLASPAPPVLLYHLLKPYGANATLCEDILATVNNGAEFFTSGYRMVRDREQLTIFETAAVSDQEYHIREKDHAINMKYGKLEFKYVMPDAGATMLSLPGFADPNTAYIDAEGIKFPLMVRRWRKGDSFQPLGMDGRKLISDFFIDGKFSSLMKETVYLLLSEGEVVWVIGHRLDERFKLNGNSGKRICFSYTPN